MRSMASVRTLHFIRTSTARFRTQLIHLSPTSRRTIASTSIARNASSHPDHSPRTRGPHPATLLVVVSIGFVAYYALVANKTRQAVKNSTEILGNENIQRKSTTTFSPENVIVIFVL